MKKKTMLVRSLIEIGAFIIVVPAVAQDRSVQSTASATDDQDDEQTVVPQQQLERTPFDNNRNGGTAQSSIGQVGQRQTRDTAAEQAGIKPTARIASRIQNRVQNRLRNRIDRNYNPQANATNPFIVAEDQARTTGRPH